MVVVITHPWPDRWNKQIHLLIWTKCSTRNECPSVLLPNIWQSLVLGRWWIHYNLLTEIISWVHMLRIEWFTKYFLYRIFDDHFKGCTWCVLQDQHSIFVRHHPGARPLTCQALRQWGLRTGNFGLDQHSNICIEDHLRFWELLKFPHHWKESKSVRFDSEGSGAAAEKPKRVLGQEITSHSQPLVTQVFQKEKFPFKGSSRMLPHG